ncbi:MAG: hypothetical protein JST82_03785 [Bacteroidetes bacterium]|nr:hypothetical protein [Bacteroidota bacterium]
MKKVLALFDGFHFSANMLEFANKLNQSGNILLTGLFLPSIDYTDVLLLYAGGMVGPLSIPTVDTDPADIKKNIALFKDYCVRNNIEHRIHDEIYDNVKKVIEQESLFADLMLLDGTSFYSTLGSITQNEYQESIARRAGCPVVIASNNFSEPESIVIAYDGTESSVFALKQFTYLLPELCSLPAVVVYATTDEKNIPDLAGMEELCSRHFKDLTFFKLDADPKRYFNTWMMDRGKAMLITGGYGTGAFMRKHFAEDVIKDHQLPVFIAHK